MTGPDDTTTVERASLDESKEIHRRTGPTFYVATRFLPERVRHATYVLYAFFRIADEVVDAAETAPPEVQRERLRTLRDAALGREPTDDPVLSAFSSVRDRYGIADEEVETFVEAMLADVRTDRYESREELETYVRGSAAAVGNMMTAIMEPADPDAARPHAMALGEAFQLTNFLRDVREDVRERDRIYLPRERMAAHGVTEAQVERLEMDEDFAALMAAELRHAEARYREGVAGIRHLPPDCRFPVLLAAVLYADHHRQIRRREYDVLSATPSLSTRRKVWLAARTRWAWAWNKDPEAVFAAVSPLGEAASHHAGGDPTPVN